MIAVRRMLAVVALGVAVSACSTPPRVPDVKPWQKGMLAKPEMTFDNDHLETRYEEHTYFSKEAASGGAGIGGGGCGCN